MNGAAKNNKCSNNENNDSKYLCEVTSAKPKNLDNFYFKVVAQGPKEALSRLLILFLADVQELNPVEGLAQEAHVSVVLQG